MRSPRPDVFEGVVPSTPRTGAHQLARLRALGLPTRLLSVVRDVDTWDDAIAVAEERPTTAFATTLHALVGARL
jgi:hypothetical protein